MGKPGSDNKNFDFTGGKPVIRSPGDEAKTNAVAQQGKTWAVGMNFAFTVMGAGLIGWILGRYVLTSAGYWPILIGLGVGLSVGLIQFVREALKANRS